VSWLRRGCCESRASTHVCTGFRATQRHRQVPVVAVADRPLPRCAGGRRPLAGPPRERRPPSRRAPEVASWGAPSGSPTAPTAGSRDGGSLPEHPHPPPPVPPALALADGGGLGRGPLPRPCARAAGAQPGSCGPASCSSPGRGLPALAPACPPQQPLARARRSSASPSSSAPARRFRREPAGRPARAWRSARSLRPPVLQQLRPHLPVGGRGRPQPRPDLARRSSSGAGRRIRALPWAVCAVCAPAWLMGGPGTRGGRLRGRERRSSSGSSTCGGRASAARWRASWRTSP
jgi:hypothetical protein